MYYVVATDIEGKEYVISSEEKIRFFAVNDIADQCMMRGLIFKADEVRMVRSKENESEPLTKHFKERRKLRAQGINTNYSF